MRESKNISVYRIVIFVVISIIIDSPYLYVLSGIFLLLFGLKHSIVYVLLVILITFTNSIKTDFIPYGIVERKVNNYYIIDKLLYKTKTYNDVEIGDILKTNTYEYIDDKSSLKKNIKFINNTTQPISKLKIRNYIYRRLLGYDHITYTTLNKFIYNVTDYDDVSFNLGYGLASYYFIKYISKKNRKLGIITLILYNIFFYFDIKFYLLLFDLIYGNNKNKFWNRFVFVCLINKCLLLNYSVLIPILFDLYRNYDFSISFRSYLFIIESMVFGYIDVVKTLIFKYLIKFQIFLFVLSLVVLVYPNLASIYREITEIYSYLNGFDYSIRGSISFLSLILFILIKRSVGIKAICECILIIILITSPFNNPFMHISFIDVGQGDATLIKLPLNRGSILIDTGSKYNYYKLKKYLMKQGIYKLNYLVITHNDEDHSGNLENLCRDFRVNEIVSKGKDISIEKVKLKYLYIDEFDNDNDSSLVYWTSINDISFLFTGDISSNAERLLVKKYSSLKADILKSSHHGSNTGNSEYLIKHILPRIATISTSGMYGHPSNETIDVFNQYLVDYYITRTSGNIEIYLTNLVNLLKTDSFDFVIIKS